MRMAPAAFGSLGADAEAGGAALGSAAKAGEDARTRMASRPETMAGERNVL